MKRVRKASQWTAENELYLTPQRIAAMRESLELWLAYDRRRRWSVTFEQPVVSVLGEMLIDEDLIDDFIQRYPSNIRFMRRRQVKYIVLCWLAEMICDVWK